MYKHNVVYTYNGMLFSFKEESKPGTKGQVLYYSTHVNHCEILKVVKFIETERRMVVAKD